MRKLQVWCDVCGAVVGPNSHLQRTKRGTATTNAVLQDVCSYKCADELLATDKAEPNATEAR